MILKPWFINGLSKLCLCQVVMYFEKFQPINSRMHTFKCVGLVILHDLELRLNETLSVDFYTLILIL